jgi:beta-glucosidase
MSEGSGEDPFLGSAMARAYVRGYQGEHLDSPDSIVACAKHYVGYGAAEGGRDYNSTEISEHTLREYYLPPFHAAEQAGAATFMSAFNSLNGIPTSANPFTLKQILKKEWGFQGFVVSDWTSVSEIMAHGIAIDGATAARKAFLAGVDMDMQSNLYHQNMLKLVQSGKWDFSIIRTPTKARNPLRSCDRKVWPLRKQRRQDPSFFCVMKLSPARSCFRFPQRFPRLH